MISLMPRGHRTEPRKKPRQPRSQDTVDVILAATQALLERGDSARLTTARIAEKAGVSVGSLYQYFPSKEAILGALLERMLTDVQTLFARTLEASRAAPLDQAIRISIGTMIQYLGMQPRIHAPLFESQWGANRIEAYRVHQGRLIELLAGYMRDRRAELRVGDVDAAALVIIGAADGVMQALAYAVPEPARGEAITREAVEFLTRYLLP